MFSGVVWASVAVTVMTVSVTQAASMAPVNSPGNVTARRDGVGSSATRVSLLKDLYLFILMIQSVLCLFILKLCFF